MPFGIRKRHEMRRQPLRVLHNGSSTPGPLTLRCPNEVHPFMTLLTCSACSALTQHQLKPGPAGRFTHTH